MRQAPKSLVLTGEVRKAVERDCRLYTNVSVNAIIAPLSDIPMFYANYLTMHNVHMHADAIKQLLYGCVYIREIIHSLKLVDYPPVHTHKPYNNLHLYHDVAHNVLVEQYYIHTCTRGNYSVN